MYVETNRVVPSLNHFPDTCIPPAGTIHGKPPGKDSHSQRPLLMHTHRYSRSLTKSYSGIPSTGIPPAARVSSSSYLNLFVAVGVWTNSQIILVSAILVFSPTALNRLCASVTSSPNSRDSGPWLLSNKSVVIKSSLDDRPAQICSVSIRNLLRTK